MAKEKGTPAGFLLNNSRGRPDFIMTMLTVIILTFVCVILFWMMLNLLAVKLSSNENIIKLLGNFNENARLIVLGLCSSIFSLAGAYYLRRSAYDKHFESLKKTKSMLGEDDPADSPAGGYAPPAQSTLTHANYDDEEEDI